MEIHDMILKKVTPDMLLNREKENAFAGEVK